MCGAAFAAPYRAALVANMDTGRVLYSENANELNYPASLTKIMTVYLTFDALEHGRLHLDDYLIVSNVAAAASPVKLGLPAGSKITVEDAIKAVTVMSANDVARVLAENLKGGKEGNFADLMTIPMLSIFPRGVLLNHSFMHPVIMYTYILFLEKSGA